MSASTNHKEPKDFYISNQTSKSNNKDIFNIFKHKQSLDTINKGNYDSGQELTTFRYCKSKLASHKKHSPLTSSNHNSSSMTQVNGSGSSKGYGESENPVNMENLPSPISKPRNRSLSQAKASVMTGINKGQIKTLNKGIIELEHENGKMKIQLREALKLIRKERERYQELEKSHIKLENLAKNLQGLGIREKARADRMEQELIKIAKRIGGKGYMGPGGDFGEAIEKAKEEVRLEKDSQIGDLKRNLEILMGEYRKLKDLNESQKPSIEEMKEKVHQFQKKIM